MPTRRLPTYDPGEPVDAASLAAFRILFGVLMVGAIARYFAHGWIDAQFVAPRYWFSYRGFEWVRPWPRLGMHLHFAALGLLALAIAIGLHTRAALALFALGFTWVQLIDKTNYLNHYYLVSLLAGWMVLLPVEALWSIDAWRHPALRRERIPRCALDVLRVQIGLVYFFAGLAKLGPDWLLRAQPLKLWLASASGAPWIGPLLATAPVAHAASWAAAAFDLTIPFWLLVRRTRRVAFAVLLVFHAATALLFPIGLFPWFMCAFATVLLDPSWPRHLLVLRRFTGTQAAGEGALRDAPPRDALPARRLRIAMGVALAMQLVLPLRHWLRPGNVLWTEDGFRFAWNVMLMEKVGTATFHARDRRTGDQLSIDPREILTPVQARMMATQPDMIAAFARHLREQLLAEGWVDPEIRADVRVSLNGRPSRPFVDPGVDLAAPETQRRGRAPLLPLGE